MTEDKDKIAREAVEFMMEADEFSRWLGIELIKVSPGYCKIFMKVRKEMLNGLKTAHGGITFSFADSAFAFASNSHGRISVALDVNMKYPKAVYEGDELIAEATEKSLNNKVAMYKIIVTNQNEEIVGLFNGTVYRTNKKLKEQ
jgi:acyl-CoA thioesterase